MLDARKNADEVGYPVVGEEIKLNANEIPYNIREEQTIDQSSVFTANNDTTTGLATVIPGINAPKLIATTSIYGDLGGEYEEIKLGGDIYTHTPLSNYGTPENDFTTFTLSNLWGDVELSQGTHGIILPVGGWYEFTFTFPTGGSSFKVDTIVKTYNGLTLYTDYGSFNSTPHVVTFKGKVEKNDELYIHCTLTYTGSSSFSYTRDMSGTIIKM